MLYIKKYSGFIISIVIGLLLYEEANYAYTYRAATAYSDHMIYRLILSMGSGSSGWNGSSFRYWQHFLWEYHMSENIEADI